MERRTWSIDLRGVKLILFALSILGASLLGSLLHSRPASAEGFLQRTVRCTLGVLLQGECRPATTTPTPAPSPSPSQNEQPASPSAPSNGGAVPTSPQATAPASGGAAPSSTQGGVGAPLPPVAPIELEAIDTPVAAAQLPQPAHRMAFSYDPVTYAAFAYGALGANAQQIAQQPVPLEQSEEGWRIFGVSWYWWALGIAAIALVVSRLRKTRHVGYPTVAK